MAYGIKGFESRYLKNQPRNGAKPTLTKDNSFLVFPFDLVMGYITSTENGIRSNDSVNVFDYSTFQRVFTGLENVLAQWSGAYNVIKKDPADTFLTKEYLTGANFRAFVPNETMEATFEPTAISGDFLAEFTQETFTLHTYHDITEEDLFKLFIIPGLKNQKWLYVTNATKFYNKDKTLDHVEITLSTLNNKIAKSGRAVEEYIQRSAPGEGYAWPNIGQDQETVTVDEIRNRDVPITSFQLEGSGAWAMATMYLYGRPTIQAVKDGATQSTFNPKIEAPRLLLPLRMETAIPSPVNTRPSAETDWLVGKFKPTLSEDFTDWKEEFSSSYNLTQRAKYEGTLKSQDNDSVVNNTNPVSAGGSRDHILWDENFDFSLDKIYNTATDAYTAETLTINKSITMPELLCHNIFGISGISTLPLSVEQNVAWSLKDIPLVGGFLSKLTYGIPFGWTNTSVKVKIDDIPLAIPASLRDYANVLIKNSDKLRIDLNTFTDEQATDDAIEFSGIKATGSIWKVSVTDRFYKTINGKQYKFGTVDLGQNGATGTASPPEADYKYGNDVKLLWDETCKPAPRNSDTPGYVIDASTFKAIAKMDYRTTFFSNENQVWSGTYQTNAKFTSSIRDWTNAIKYSNWKESNNQQIDYPASIVAPNPPNINAPVIKLDPIIGSIFVNTLFYDPRKISPNSLDFNDNEVQFENIYKLDTTPYGGIQSFLTKYKELRITLNENTGTFVKNSRNKSGTYFTAGEKTIVTNIIKNDRQININIDTTTLLNSGSVETNIAVYNNKINIGSEVGIKIANLIADVKITSILRLSINGNTIEVSIKAKQEYTNKKTIGIPGEPIYSWSIVFDKQTLFESYELTSAIASPQ